MKNFDYKALFINHGEKMALGLIGLLSVLVLVGTSWGTYQGTPDELDQKAKQTRQSMEASTWPAADRQKFENVEDIREQTKLLSVAVTPEQFQYSTPMTWPIIQPKEKIKEPTWGKPRDVIADFGRVIVWVKPPEEDQLADASVAGSATGGSKPGTPAEDLEDDSEFAVNTPGGGRGAAAASGVYPGGGAGSFADESMEDFGDDVGDGDMMYDEAMMERMAESSGMGGGGGMMMNTAASSALKNTSRGERYVAVRGIFDLRDQRRAMEKAFNLQPNDPLATELIYIVDIHLQRKESVPGPDPWSGEWEPVDLQTAMDVLEQCNGLDQDVVAPGATDPVCTMPLPPRVMGRWKHASHPDVDKYKLSEEEKELIRKQQELLVKIQQEQEAAAPPPKAEKKGFASAVVDINRVRQSVVASGQFKSYMSEMQDYARSMGGTMGSTMAGGQFNTRQLDATPTASGNLLLIRYLDFAVVPGNTYRYRVRLEFRNPNFQSDISELANPDSAIGDTRLTEWSEMSEPVSVPLDFEYYVEKVQRRTGRDPTVEVDLFQWHPEAGTKVNSVLKLTLGQFIGGRQKTEVIRPGAQTLEEEEFDFGTGDLIVDLDTFGRVNPDDHPDLTIPDRKGYLGIADEMLVVDRNGKLDTLDSVSLMPQRGAAAGYISRLFAAFDGYRSKGTVTASGGMSEDMMQEMMGGEGMMGSGRGRSRRRGSSRRGSNPLANPGMFYPGGGE